METVVKSEFIVFVEMFIFFIYREGSQEHYRQTLSLSYI